MDKNQTEQKNREKVLSLNCNVVPVVSIHLPDHTSQVNIYSIHFADFLGLVCWPQGWN